MTKRELAIKISVKMGLSIEDSIEVIDTIFSSISESVLDKREKVRFCGFGVFDVADKKAKKGRNAKTGEIIDIPARTEIKFKSSKNLIRDKNVCK